MPPACLDVIAALLVVELPQQVKDGHLHRVLSIDASGLSSGSLEHQNRQKRAGSPPACLDVIAGLLIFDLPQKVKDGHLHQVVSVEASGLSN